MKMIPLYVYVVAQIFITVFFGIQISNLRADRDFLKLQVDGLEKSVSYTQEVLMREGTHL